MPGNWPSSRLTERVLQAVMRYRELTASDAGRDVESLTHLISLSDDIDNAIQQAVTGLRAVGYSWAEISARLGITRQAAQQRWGCRY